MTSRISHAGVVVIVLVSLFAVGCTPQTSAVFESLLGPASAPASPSDDDAEVGAGPGSTATWWPHPDGYAMALPAGWSGVSMTAGQTDQLIDAVASSYPGLGERLHGVMAETRSRLSMVGAEPATGAEVPAVILVVSQPTDGRNKRFIKTRTYEQISALPGLRGAVIRDDERLANAVGVRFDYVVDDADLGALRVRSYLFRFGGQAYVVSFIASVATFDDSEAAFDSIANSLRFGV